MKSNGTRHKILLVLGKHGEKKRSSSSETLKLRNFELETLNFGDVAQLGERGVRNAEARSSILLISTNFVKALSTATPFLIPARFSVQNRIFLTMFLLTPTINDTLDAGRARVRKH